MARATHVDEIAHHQAAHVAQAQLAADLVHRLLVGLEGVGLAVACAAALAAVHVDGHQCLGLVEHQCAARWQRHHALIDVADLPLEVEGGEDGRGLVVVQHARRILGEHHVQERRHAGPRALAVHHDVADGVVHHLAHGADEHVALGVQLAWRAHALDALAHGFPQAREIGGVALQLGAAAIEARGAQDEAAAIRQLERIQDATHLAALGLVLHLAADAHLVHVGHHHEQAARDAEVAGDGRALRADALLDHLHEHFLALLQALLDGRTLATRNLVTHALGLVATGEVLRVHVTDVQEAVLALAEVDEGCLDGGLHVGDAALVDVAHVRGAAGALGEVVLQTTAAREGDAALVAGGVVHDHHGVARTLLGLDWLGGLWLGAVGGGLAFAFGGSSALHQELAHAGVLVGLIADRAWRIQDLALALGIGRTTGGQRGLLGGGPHLAGRKVLVVRVLGGVGCFGGLGRLAGHHGLRGHGASADGVRDCFVVWIRVSHGCFLPPWAALRGRTQRIREPPGPCRHGTRGVPGVQRLDAVRVIRSCSAVTRACRGPHLAGSFRGRPPHACGAEFRFPRGSGRSPASKVRGVQFP